MKKFIKLLVRKFSGKAYLCFNTELEKVNLQCNAYCSYFLNYSIEKKIYAKSLFNKIKLLLGTASIMASGFFNTIRQSLKEKWEVPITTEICVHDSSTSYFSVDKIFEMREFLDKYYTDYCASIGPKIKLLFDLNQGNGYESAAGVVQKEKNVLEFKGNAMTLIPIYEKIFKCFGNRVICSMSKEELIPNYVTSPVLRFIEQGGTCIVMDKSKYKIQFTKVG